MACVEVFALERWEALADGGQVFVRDVGGLRSAHEEGGAVPVEGRWVGPSRDVVDVVGENGERHPGLVGAIGGGLHVGEEELADRERCLGGAEQGVALLERAGAGGLDSLEGGDVAAELGEARVACGEVDGRVVDGDEAGEGGVPTECDGHGALGAHGVAQQDGRRQRVVGEKGLDVGRHVRIVVGRGVGRVAVVAEVEGEDGRREAGGQRARDGPVVGAGAKQAMEEDQGR